MKKRSTKKQPKRWKQRMPRCACGHLHSSHEFSNTTPHGPCMAISSAVAGDGNLCQCNKYVPFTPVHVAHKPRKPVQTYTTVGVRYAQGPNINRVFTYKVRVPHPFKLGDPVAVDARGGMVIAFIVRIDAKPNDQDRMFTYKWIRHQIKELWAEPTFDPDKVDTSPTPDTDDEEEWPT